MHIGDYYGNRNENDSALYYFNKAKYYFKDINSTRGLIFINHSLASIKESTSNLDEAIAITKETLTLIKNTKSYKHRDPNKKLVRYYGVFPRIG